MKLLVEMTHEEYINYNSMEELMKKNEAIIDDFLRQLNDVRISNTSTLPSVGSNHIHVNQLFKIIENIKKCK